MFQPIPLSVMNEALLNLSENDSNDYVDDDIRDDYEELQALLKNDELESILPQLDLI